MPVATGEKGLDSEAVPSTAMGTVSTPGAAVGAGFPFALMAVPLIKLEDVHLPSKG